MESKLYYTAVKISINNCLILKRAFDFKFMLAELGNWLPAWVLNQFQDKHTLELSTFNADKTLIGMINLD